MLGDGCDSDLADKARGAKIAFGFDQPLYIERISNLEKQFASNHIFSGDNMQAIGPSVIKRRIGQHLIIENIFANDVDPVNDKSLIRL